MSKLSTHLILKWFALVVFSIPLTAAAQRPQDFSAKQCSTCPTMTEMPWKFPIGVRGTEVGIDPNCAGSPSNPCPHYNNWTHLSRFITGNGYIQQVGLNFTSFDTEPVNDTFSFGEVGGTMTALSGSLTPGWHDITVSGSLQSTPAVAVFSSDDTISHPGLEVDGARVCCSATETPGIIDIEPHLRYTGFLVSTADAVFYRFPASDETTHTTIALWGYKTDDPDPLHTVDVYVRCNQLPTRVYWDYRGVRHSQQEFIHIPEGDSPPSCEGDWYVAVYSRGGAHTYNLVVANHFESQHRTLRAGFETTIPSEPLLSSVVDALSAASKYYFGATEGTQYFDGVEVYTTGTPCRNTTLCGGTVCDICFHDEIGSSSATLCHPVWAIRMQQPRWNNATVIAHEMGHKFFCVPDEYSYAPESLGCRQCGHTIMSTAQSSEHNFCYAHTTGSLENHTKDAEPGCPPTVHEPAWDIAFGLGLTPWKPSETPDNHNYLDFDFAGKVGGTVVY